MLMNRKGFFIAFLVLSSTLVAFFLYKYVFYPPHAIKDVSIQEINSNPQSFDGVHVRLHGYVVNTSVYMFGPKYILRNFDDEVEIALGTKGGPEKVDLEPYVSFVFDGENYTQIRNLRVSVVGHVRYIGPVMDAPPFHLEVKTVQPQTGTH